VVANPKAIKSGQQRASLVITTFLGLQGKKGSMSELNPRKGALEECQSASADTV
jgi:hypothetical protein